MRVQYMRAKRIDVTRTFGPSVCENPTLNSNNNFYPPRLSRHRGPLIYYFQCRMHPAFVPLLCHHNQDANRGALVVEYTSLMV